MEMHLTLAVQEATIMPEVTIRRSTVELWIERNTNSIAKEAILREMDPTYLLILMMEDALQSYTAGRRDGSTEGE